MEESVVSRLKAVSVTNPITVAIDDYTNTNHIKITNVMPIAGGIAYYWNTLFNNLDERHSADWLYPRLKQTFVEMITANITVVAIVADNASVNNLLYDKLKKDYPFLVHVPCSAHTLALEARLQFERVPKCDNSHVNYD